MNSISESQRRLRVQVLANLVAEKYSQDHTRHKCFVSYHVDDSHEVERFINDFGSVFIPTAVGITENDDFVDSNDFDYILRRIREKYLTDTTVTMVMIGKCTWSRRFIDWEIAATLRDDPNNKRSGLMAITLPSVSAHTDRRVPDRVDDNILGDNGDEGYARWWKYPSSAESLRSLIDTAFAYRTQRAHLIDNTRKQMLYNKSC